MKGLLSRCCALALFLPVAVFAVGVEEEKQRERKEAVAGLLGDYDVIALAGAAGGVEFLKEPKDMDPKLKAGLTVAFGQRGRLYEGCLCLRKSSGGMFYSAIRPQGEVRLRPMKGKPLVTEIEEIARILDEEKAQEKKKAEAEAARRVEKK
ncbi:hypothetical protein OKA05_29040 [Luteolibacter arcticus]|uniref:Inhibitor of vertebrate lysozyme (Ivy) n=1 Tax=Luteolibacter arcticus TaxID=1581411 RepID=A0ABT3GT28_9BACT|nr:hypothetical protein [Luteolibacter arcticus]MCW1926634.1 hypothetical protein [Luteolibacter arcticus]